MRQSRPIAGTYARPNLIADPFQSGPVAANPDPACQKTGAQGGRAPDAVGTTSTWFNPCAFAIPSGTFGNLGRWVLGARGAQHGHLDVQELPAAARGLDGPGALRSIQFVECAELGRTLGHHDQQCQRGADYVSTSGTTPRQMQIRPQAPVLTKRHPAQRLLHEPQAD